jgi:hypothetical protein
LALSKASKGLETEGVVATSAEPAQSKPYNGNGIDPVTGRPLKSAGTVDSINESPGCGARKTELSNLGLTPMGLAVATQEVYADLSPSILSHLC